MEFFKTLQDIILAQNPTKKIEKFYLFYYEYKKGSISFDHTQNSRLFDKPSYHTFCKIVPATKVRRRRAIKSREDRAILLHSIAHIEYSAIDLALDHAYRFKNMPIEFYDDWLEVADDEIRHFLMMQKLLKELGYGYGDFEVHSFLFDTSKATQKLIDRMAVIPRYLEASGLDANPKIIQRVDRFEDEFLKKIKISLLTIMDEEVDHVKKGDKWFKWACEKEGVETQRFYQIVEKFLPGASRKKEFVNVEFRKRAGYSCEELKIISKNSFEC